MPQDISKIGSVTEKSFKKPDSFDPEKLDKKEQSEKDGQAFSQLLDENVPLKNESKVSIDGSDLALGETAPRAGDKILNAFQGMKDNIDMQRNKVDNLLNSDEIMSMRDMFKTQRAMANLTLTQDLIGKVVGKSTQNIETLMKQQ